MTPDAIETLLGDFRAWLLDAVAAPEPPPPGATGPLLDVASVLQPFVALRHEVNLQTKAVRAQQEQNAETLQALRQALDVIEQRSSARAEDTPAAQRPLLHTLVDLHDALSLAQRELPKLPEALAPLFQILAGIGAAPAPKPMSWWRRWLGPAQAAPAGTGPEWQHEANRAASRIEALLDSFRAGYTMGLQRVERALAQHGLEPIPAVGAPFDPEQMEVVDVVAGTGRPAGEVVAEIRRGYQWHGRVFRYALVQVAR